MALNAGSGLLHFEKPFAFCLLYTYPANLVFAVHEGDEIFVGATRRKYADFHRQTPNVTNRPFRVRL